MICLASISGDLANAAQDTAKTFGWSKEHFIAQCISFAIVAFLLHRFAYKPILKVLEERKQRIAEGLANADKIKVERLSKMPAEFLAALLHLDEDDRFPNVIGEAGAAAVFAGFANAELRLAADIQIGRAHV